MTNKHHLKCIECTLPAGYYEQHYNLPDGFGICPECAFSLANSLTRIAMESMYGLAQINYGLLQEP